MLVDFNSMPDSSRIWIYQSSRVLSPEEQSWLAEKSAAFVSAWTAHQADLKAAVLVTDGLFVVFAVDESFNEASGCSLDKKVAFIKDAEKQLALNFFERMNFAWVDLDNEIKLSRLHDLDNLIASGSITENTIVHNNLVSSMKEFRNHWKSPLAKTWMMQFVRKITN